jgi:hypothetical protein
MNLGSHILALLNEHAVEHADGSIIWPQLCLQSAPFGLLQEYVAEVLQDESQPSMHACTGSAAGLLSGIIITWGSGLGRTFVGILLTGTEAG